ncbi:hypothetical protein [Thaumasiovibrio sp. DFM-14]|uniref:hypothetical protein n=1 Tax=Thaumasiovibrio sp. DFM-14 TaxID=3384792 RepID=UPI0039A07508
MAKPHSRGPTRTIDIFCAKCRTPLFHYRKGGKGNLVKCFKERIVKDYTVTPCCCPNCDSLFARETLIRGAPALKMIGGKVTFK